MVTTSPRFLSPTCVADPSGEPSKVAVQPSMSGGRFDVVMRIRAYDAVTDPTTTTTTPPPKRVWAASTCR